MSNIVSKDLDYLGRTFAPKVIIYNSDGGGRDQYIQTNNGGFYHGVKPMGVLENFEIKRYSHMYNIRYCFYDFYGNLLFLICIALLATSFFGVQCDKLCLHLLISCPQEAQELRG